RRPPRTSRRHPAIATPVSLDDKVLAVLRKRRKHGVRADDLVRAARLTPNEAAQLPDRIDHLPRTGALVERARGRLRLATDSRLVSGRLHAHPDGFAFV